MPKRDKTKLMSIQRRKRKARWLTYAQASAIVKEAGCSSKIQFRKWMAIARPNNIPLQPNRVYKEWIGWGDFLGVYNTFGHTTHSTLRPYWEAVRWAQRFCIDRGITRVVDWWAYYDEHEDEMPEDIPRNGQYHYKDEWTGWQAWMGTKLEARVVVAKEEIGVFALCNMPWAPLNVIRVIVAHNGITELREKCLDHGVTVVKAYKFESELADQMQQVLHACGGQQPDGTFIIRDMNNLMFEFSCLLIEVRL